MVLLEKKKKMKKIPFLAILPCPFWFYIISLSPRSLQKSPHHEGSKVVSFPKKKV